jgi:hypothetical protein
MGKCKILLISVAALALSSCNSSGEYRNSRVYNRAVVSGGELSLGPYSNLNPDCSLAGHPRIKVIQAPRQGTFTTRMTSSFSTYAETHSRAHCNTRRTPGLDVVYRAQPGASGADQVIFEVIWPNGLLDLGTINVSIR